ncbi:restriction endonuclease [Psychrobacter sp. ANT_H59]|uniref:restriction endonuclease n=1 Tax=Psychrobacter sp. ANT_H59 TaxID=2597354 RepID=UPI0011EF93B0|nr:restriction endonuclease [Psychrobacter sp. ANT_H59]KAA0939155.1 restriction endonuclease [Psychrobacter sp. ANT_H59]
MNTVKIGDIFEDKCYDLIEHAVKNDKLGISASHARVFRKKKYYSDKRKKDIIFDLAIEIWPEDAKNYSMLLIIECKNYRTKDVPVDDVEEFESKVDQVSGKNAKAIMISARSFQEGAFNFAKSTGMMLIEAH